MNLKLIVGMAMSLAALIFKVQNVSVVEVQRSNEMGGTNFGGE